MYSYSAETQDFMRHTDIVNVEIGSANKKGKRKYTLMCVRKYHPGSSVSVPAKRKVFSKTFALSSPPL